MDFVDIPISTIISINTDNVYLNLVLVLYVNRSLVYIVIDIMSSIVNKYSVVNGSSQTCKFSQLAGVWVGFGPVFSAQPIGLGLEG